MRPLTQLIAPLEINATHFDRIIVDPRLLSGTAVPRIRWKDITDEVMRVVAHSQIREGLVVVQTCHTTTALVLNENEEGLVTDDLPRFLTRLCPAGSYMHDREERLASLLNEPANGVSHLQSVLTGGIPPLIISNHKIQFGTWQSVLFYDFDPENRPSRTLVVQVLGVR